MSEPLNLEELEALALERLDKPVYYYDAGGAALGASADAVGRPQLWGLAAGGEEGVRRVLEMLRDELALAMPLAGCRTLSEIDRSLVAP